MSRRRKAHRQNPITPEARERAIVLYGRLIEAEMLGILKADTLESKYAGLRPALRELTERQLKGVATRAAQYVVENARPSPSALSREECERLTAAGMAVGLTQLQRDTRS